VSDGSQDIDLRGISADRVGALRGSVVFGDLFGRTEPVLWGAARTPRPGRVPGPWVIDETLRVALGRISVGGAR